MAVENLQVTVFVATSVYLFPFFIVSLRGSSSNGGSASSRIWFFKLLRRKLCNRWLCAWILKVSF